MVLSIGLAWNANFVLETIVFDDIIEINFT